MPKMFNFLLVPLGKNQEFHRRDDEFDADRYDLAQEMKYSWDTSKRATVKPRGGRIFAFTGGKRALLRRKPS